jgi:NADH dehydrogenase
MRKLIAGADAVIYNIGILREFPSAHITFEKSQRIGAVRAADLAVECGVRRFLLMSANGVELTATDYQRTKLAAEEHLKSLDLDWTIFRPSVIFGDPQGREEFASMLKRDILDSPMPAPLFYTGLLPRDAGAFEFSPVHVRDVAAAFVGALEETATHGHTYTLGGPATLSWKDILSTIASACGTTKLMLPVPAIGPMMAAAFFDRYAWFPISRDQIRMLTLGNVCDGDAIFDLLGIRATPFDAGNLKYLTAKAISSPPSTKPA